MYDVNPKILVSPVTSRCRAISTESKHICFGISPFNSYYSEARIKTLAEWGMKYFSSMHFFVPDIPSAYTFEALGYTAEKSAWKARRQCQYLFNKISKSLDALGFNAAQINEMIVGWNRLNENEVYLKLHQEAILLYETDPYFKSACNEASLWVLEKKIPMGVEINEQILNSGVKYLLSEIPLFINSTGIFSEKFSVFSYHQPVAFIKELFEKKLSLLPHDNQGFLIVDAIIDRVSENACTVMM